MSQKKILMIDDDPDFVFAISMVLEAEGYLLETASNGVEGLKKLRADLPDLVLMDVIMAGPLDGYYTAQEIADDPVLRNVPILMISSIANTPYVSLFPTDQYLAVVDFMFKPIDPTELLEKIRALLK